MDKSDAMYIYGGVPGTGIMAAVQLWFSREYDTVIMVDNLGGANMRIRAAVSDLLRCSNSSFNMTPEDHAPPSISTWDRSLH